MRRLPDDDEAERLGFVFREEMAEHCREWIRDNLIHIHGEWAGKPFELLPWQWEDIIKPLFGWVHQDTSFRRYRRCVVWISKKNGKSTLGAAIGAYMLVGDGESAAEVYSAAVNRDQASIVHRSARMMIERSPTLGGRLRVNRADHTIYFDETQSWYQAMSGDSASKEGPIIHCAICDEIHAWKTGALWDVLVYGIRSRRQPMIFSISTAGEANVQSFAYGEYLYSRDILNGRKTNYRMLPVIYESTEDDDPGSPATWRKANPSLGTTFQEEDIRLDWLEACEKPRMMATFLRRTLGRWTESEECWIPMDKWRACQRPDLTLADFQDRPCFGAIDVASKDDLSAFTLCAELDDGSIGFMAWYWCCREGAEQRSRLHDVPYLQWEDKGYLTLTPGDVTDYDHIKAFVIGLRDDEDLDLHEIVFDPYNCMQMAQSLDNEGYEMVQMPPNYRQFNEPSRLWEELILSGRLAHDGHPVLTWNVQNVVAVENAWEQIFPKKPKDNPHMKIDGAVCMIMSLARLLSEGPSVGIELV